MGDYIFQTDHMAQEKTKKWWPAIAHGLTYGIPFLIIGVSPLALAVIIGTHIIIDRYRLAKYLVWLKNQFAPKAFRPVWRKGPVPAAETPATAAEPSVHDVLSSLIHHRVPPSAAPKPADTTNYANKATGYSEKTPDWMAVWLMIIADNSVHIVINTIAILVFGTIWL